MTSYEALEIALSKEKGSIELYKKLASEHSEISDFLTQLLNEEEKHRKLIENKLSTLMR